MKTLLKIERQKRKLKIEQVANELGLSRPGYLNIEAGRRKPSIDIAFKLEDLFGIPARELLATAENEEESP